MKGALCCAIVIKPQGSLWLNFHAVDLQSSCCRLTTATLLLLETCHASLLQIGKKCQLELVLRVTTFRNCHLGTPPPSPSFPKIRRYYNESQHTRVGMCTLHSEAPITPSKTTTASSLYSLRVLVLIGQDLFYLVPKLALLHTRRRVTTFPNCHSGTFPPTSSQKIACAETNHSSAGAADLRSTQKH